MMKILKWYKKRISDNEIRPTHPLLLEIGISIFFVGMILLNLSSIIYAFWGKPSQGLIITIMTVAHVYAFLALLKGYKTGYSNTYYEIRQYQADLELFKYFFRNSKISFDRVSVHRHSYFKTVSSYVEKTPIENTGLNQNRFLECLVAINPDKDL